jgi:hypothetical protein
MIGENIVSFGIRSALVFVFLRIEFIEIGGGSIKDVEDMALGI